MVGFILINPLSASPTKWSNTLKQFVLLSVFDVFVGLVYKGLRKNVFNFNLSKYS